MKTYNKGNTASQARDLLTTIKRYYSNSFTDSEKQNAINLFLGRFEPSREKVDIWDLESDWFVSYSSNACNILDSNFPFSFLSFGLIPTLPSR